MKKTIIQIIMISLLALLLLSACAPKKVAEKAAVAPAPVDSQSITKEGQSISSDIDSTKIGQDPYTDINALDSDVKNAEAVLG